MNVAPPAPVSLLDSALTAERIRTEWEVAVLTKVRENTIKQGSAIVALIEAAVSPPPAPQSAPTVPPNFDQLA